MFHPHAAKGRRKPSPFVCHSHPYCCHSKERSDEDVIAMLKERVQPIHVEEWAAMQPRSA